MARTRAVRPFLSLNDVVVPQTNRYHNIPLEGKLSFEYDKIIHELRFGEAWNALSRLRRYIEISLNEAAVKKGFLFERHISAMQLLKILEKREIINYQIFRNLQYSITICNKAIHGVTITDSEAEEAIYHGGQGLVELLKIEE